MVYSIHMHCSSSSFLSWLGLTLPWGTSKSSLFTRGAGCPFGSRFLGVYFLLSPMDWVRIPNGSMWWTTMNAKYQARYVTLWQRSYFDSESRYRRHSLCRIFQSIFFPSCFNSLHLTSKNWKKQCNSLGLRLKMIHQRMRTVDKNLWRKTTEAKVHPRPMLTFFYLGGVMTRTTMRLYVSLV